MGKGAMNDILSEEVGGSWIRKCKGLEPGVRDIVLKKLKKIFICG